MKDHIVVCFISAQTPVASELSRSYSNKVKEERMQITKILKLSLSVWRHLFTVQGG